MRDDPRFALHVPDVRRHFDRAAGRYDHAAVLAREVGRRMDARLDYVKLAPQRVLDLGCGTGGDGSLITQRYPNAHYVGLDASLAMLRAGPQRQGWRRWLPGRSFSSRVCADAACLPLPNCSVELIWSNFMLHWVPDPLPVFSEMHRVLATDGLLMFACLGPDTLKELRNAWAKADPHGLHVHRFIDMHDLGDMLVAAGFAEPVMDMETLTLTYPDLDTLARDVRGAGGANALAGRARGLMGKGRLQALHAALQPCIQGGRLSMSFEVIYGHAWKPQPRVTSEGHAIVRFDPTQRGMRPKP